MYFGVPHKTESHTALEQHKDEVNFWINCPFNAFNYRLGLKCWFILYQEGVVDLLMKGEKTQF